MFQNRPSARAATLRARKPLVGLVAAVAVASLVGSASTPDLVTVADSELPVSPGDRVLQAVEIAMGPDGTLTAVEGTTVTASADGEGADSTTQAYSPDDVVSDLPVRVLTSYRTADGTGSDLADLQGYDGQVQIDLTVQNLTVEAQDITYDVPGGSRTRPALVGAPLTIVAAADLGDTDPARVVTQSAGEDRVTNGVLSQGADGATRVQWATILAPPQLSSSATLSLVVDAKDFSAPAFDLSVQPGLVTDPSVGALVENAFNPAASEELALQARTVEVVGDVNEVLAEAGDSISAVRDSLNSTTDTLGQKTVGDLETSIVGIANSMEALDGTVTGLGDGISSALDSTGSSSLAQLESTVSSVDSLLGDTSGKPSTATVNGTGCNTTVRTGTGGGGVYDSLLRVASTLNGYASANDACKESLQVSLAAAIGPSDLEDCDDPKVATSVTCSLRATQEQFDGVSDSLVKAGEAAIKTFRAPGIDGVGIDGVVDAADEVAIALGKVQQNMINVRDGLPTTATVDTSAVEKELDAVLIASAAGMDTIDDIALPTGDGSPARLIELNNQVASQLCERAKDDAELGDLYRMVSSTPCVGVLDEPSSTSTSMESQLEKTDAAWTAVSDALSGISGELETANTAASAGLRALGRLQGGPNNAKVVLTNLLRAFGSETTPTRLSRAREELADEALKFETRLTTAEESLRTAFADAADGATDKVDGAATKSIDEVTKRSTEAREDVGDAFDNSQQGMRAAADGIAADGREAINEQKDGLDKASKEATSAIDANVRQGLDVIADTVSASTRDTDAAGKLLTADLTKVLLDLGDPEVEGAGLLGTLGANAGDARAADFQLALATRTASSYANARGQDIGGLMLRQAQAEAAFARQAQLQAFQVDVPEGVERRTVYSFHLAAGQ